MKSVASVLGALALLDLRASGILSAFSSACATRLPSASHRCLNHASSPHWAGRVA